MWSVVSSQYSQSRAVQGEVFGETIGGEKLFFSEKFPLPPFMTINNLNDRN